MVPLGKDELREEKRSRKDMAVEKMESLKEVEVKRRHEMRRIRRQRMGEKKGSCYDNVEVHAPRLLDHCLPIFLCQEAVLRLMLCIIFIESFQKMFARILAQI